MRVRITNSSINSYGTRVLTSGMDIEQYKRNPVLLYMHERGNVIGYVKDVKVEGDDITGELLFDEASDLSKRCKKQYEFGSLKMVSAGIDILEMSQDLEVLVADQKHPTITKSKLFEVSLVDIGANDDAIVLQHNGKKVELGKDGKNTLPLLNVNQKQMDQKTIALRLGMPETATEAEIIAKMESLKENESDVVKLKKEKDDLMLASITSAVDNAIKEKRISEDRKDQFIKLGKSVGLDELQNTLSAIQPQAKLSSIIGHQGGQPSSSKNTYAKLSEVPEDEIEKLRNDDPTTYKKLYKAEYGMSCEI